MAAPPDLYLPFPVVDVSNGEWCPRPASPLQRLAARLIGEACDTAAHRHGLTRAQFLRTAAGTATAFMVLNTVHGLDRSGDAAVLPVRREQCDDLDAAADFLSDRYFIVDVQTHHVDLTLPLVARFPGAICGLRFLEPALACEQRLQLLGQANYVKEVLVDSETDVAVVSGVPQATILPAETMAATRDLANQLAGGTERCIIQAIIDPLNPPASATSTASLEHQVRDRGARAIKCYTGNPGGSWWLDDETTAYPMYEEARRLGIGLVNVHKGFPNLLGPQAPQYVQSRDLPKVVQDWPDLKFCVYHSGYFPDGTGISEFIRVVSGIPRRRRRRIYAEIGSAFAVAFTQGPEQAAHLVGQLLRTLGPRNVVWGTDSVWWGSPQWQICAFKTLRIPAAMQEKYGYPALTKKTKRRILGLNAAALYGLDPHASRAPVQLAELNRVIEVAGGFPAERSLRTYGPRTRREFLALLAGDVQRAS